MNQQRGFTLLELMVAVAMIAIVATIASPSWREFVANRRTAGVSREIYNALQHTRMLAIKEGRTVSVQFAPGPETFRSLRMGFDSGTSSGALLEIDDTELQLKVDLPDGVKGSVNRQSMEYNSRGILNGNDNGTITVWSALTRRQYQVVVSNLGTLREVSGIHP